MDLLVLEGNWGLPSVDPVCLQVMAYCKFSGAPVKITKSKGINQVCYDLPYFTHGLNIKLTKFKDIIAHLRKQNYCADFDLSQKQCSDIIAYSSLLKNSLYPALLYISWMDEQNYTEVTRPWYAKILPFPLNYFIPGHMQRKAIKTIHSLQNYENINEEQRETQIYKKAEECMTLLSERLGENEFFFGKRPCSADALVFGYLAPILKIPFPNAALQNYLKSCDNLNQFVNRILQRYFPVLNEENTNSKSKNETSQDFPHKWRDIILSGAFAASAMVLYAFGSGLISVEIVNDQIESEEERDFEEDQKK
ncbi:metaxin-1 isoform X2 [Centruroides vittatus]|uniref:metaxin-1 isoform X2 n=1 Tax=Centruroides vittatus TaxID=120091 RepID=UPI00350F85FF